MNPTSPVKSASSSSQVVESDEHKHYSTCNNFSKKTCNFSEQSVEIDFNDSDDPSSDLLHDLARVLALIADERHLVAHSLFVSVKNRLKERKANLDYEKNTRRSHSRRKVFRKVWKGVRSSQTPPIIDKLTTDNQSPQQGDDYEQAENFISSNEKIFISLENRAHIFQSARENMAIDDEWSLSQTLFGISTYFRREKDGTLSVKIEGKMEGVPLIEQIAIMRELDLIDTWAPLVSQSKTLRQSKSSKIEAVGWFETAMPLLGIWRDVVFRVVGCDSMREDGCVMLVAKGVDLKKIPSLSDKENDSEQVNSPILSPVQNAFESSVLSSPSTPSFVLSKNQTLQNTNDAESNSLSDAPVQYSRSRGLSEDGTLQNGNLENQTNDDSTLTPPRFVRRRSSSFPSIALLSDDKFCSQNLSVRNIESNASPGIERSVFKDVSTLTNSHSSDSVFMQTALHDGAADDDVESILKDLNIPPVPTKFGHGRITINSCYTVIDILSPESGRTKIVANIDLSLKHAPKGLGEFVIKRFFSVFIFKTMDAARKIVKNPVHSPHARRMREDTAFYRDWLLPKFKAYCEEVDWEMPTVAAFEVDHAVFEMEKNSPRDLRNPFEKLHSKILLEGGLEALNPVKRRELAEQRRRNLIESLRKKQADSLKPTPFSLRQKRRVDQLMEMKKRLNAERETSGAIDPTAQGLSMIEVSKQSGSGIRGVRSFFRRPELQPVVMICAMFIFYFGNGPVGRWLTETVWKDGSKCAVFMCWTILTGIYGYIHMCVLFSIADLAFAAIESHSSLTRNYFRVNVQTYASRITILIIFSCSIWSFFSTVVEDDAWGSLRINGFGSVRHEMSMSLVDGGVRKWAASSLEMTKLAMAQFASFLVTLLVIGGIFLKPTVR